MDIFNIDDNPTAKVLAEWKSLRRDLGKLRCHIDGIVQGVTTIHQAREKSKKKGYHYTIILKVNTAKKQGGFIAWKIKA